MAEDSPEDKPTHASKHAKKSRSLRVLPSDSAEAWPANVGELLQWYTHEVEDVTRAAQLRLQDATKLVAEYREGKTSIAQAAKGVLAHDLKWGQIFPGQIEGVVRGQSDEAIHKAIGEFRGRTR